MQKRIVAISYDLTDDGKIENSQVVGVFQIAELIVVLGQLTQRAILTDVNVPKTESTKSPQG